MSFGMGGSSQTTSGSQSRQSTTPFSGLASSMIGTLKKNLGDLASGKSLSNTISALTSSTARQTKAGIASLKEAFGASGMRMSSSLAKSIADFQTGQTTALNTQIAGAEQADAQTQLGALAEIIGLGAGTGTETGTSLSQSSGFGWNFAASLIGQ